LAEMNFGFAFMRLSPCNAKWEQRLSRRRDGTWTDFAVMR
jgi:hypothetical protein